MGIELFCQTSAALSHIESPASAILIKPFLFAVMPHRLISAEVPLEMERLGKIAAPPHTQNALMIPADLQLARQAWDTSF